MSGPRELRDALLKSVDVEQCVEDCEDLARSEFLPLESKWRMKTRLTAHMDELAELKQRIEDFAESSVDLSDTDFETQVAEFAERLDTLSSLIKEGEEYLEKRARIYKVDFVGVDQVQDYETYLETLPMYWMPVKEDVVRILSAAVSLHEERVARGEKESEDPVQIVDVGGANGFLGKLIVDLADKNGIVLEYTIVDPDTESVDKAESHYCESTPALHFVKSTVQDFVRQIHGEDADVQELFREREEVINAENRIVNNMKLILRPYGSFDCLEPEMIETLRSIVQHELSTDVGEVFDDSYGYPQSIIESYVHERNENAKDPQKEIANHLSEKPASVDLVLNSWMTANEDFSLYVRSINAAGVVYCIDNYGSTGIQDMPGAPYRRSPHRVGDRDSYQSNEMYSIRFGWVGPATIPLIDKVYLAPKMRLPFSNGIVVQNRVGYGSNLGKDMKSSRIDAGDPYPWEARVQEHVGEVGPLIDFDELGVDHFDYNELASKARELSYERRREKGIPIEGFESWG